MHDTGVIVLAAGGSTRMGVPKQLLAFEGTTLLRRAAETALASRCHPIVVVLGAHHEACMEELAGLPVRVVCNPNWKEGMGTSLHVGLEALLEEVVPSSVILMLCDQPLLTAAMLDGLIDAFHEGGNTLVASQYSGTIGVPALFSRALFSELLTLSGEKGARSVIECHRAKARLLPFPNGALDIDTSDDYACLREYYA